MRCKQCGRKMHVVRGRYAVCLRGCGRIVMFENNTVQPWFYIYFKEQGKEREDGRGVKDNGRNV